MTLRRPARDCPSPAGRQPPLAFRGGVWYNEENPGRPRSLSPGGRPAYAPVVELADTMDLGDVTSVKIFITSTSS